MTLMQSKSCLVALSMALPLCASALSTTTTRSLNMRGGPSTDFEVVAVLPCSTSVRVNGCHSSWRWCTVVSRRHRGWVDARFLRDPVRGRVPIVNERGNPRPSRPTDWHQRPVG